MSSRCGRATPVASSNAATTAKGPTTLDGTFAMTCGVIVPVTRDLIEEVTLDALAWRRGDPEQVAQDPRFATAIYRAALDSGIMDHVAYE